MQILGIDVGGTGIKGAIVETSTGELASERLRIETPPAKDPKPQPGGLMGGREHRRYAVLDGALERSSRRS